MNSLFESVIEKHRLLFFSVIAGFIVFSTKINHPILDGLFMFHEGEYVGLLWSIRAFYEGLAPFPLLIHGAMDYIPSIISAHIYGDDRVIVGTRAINTIVVWFSWILFLDICYLLIAKKSARQFWLAVALVIFIAITPPLFSQALFVQQAFLGTRDLFVLITVWCFTKQISSESRKSEFVFLALGSASAVTSIFWSYDRGMMLIPFVGIIFLGALIGKKYINAVLIALFIILSLLLFNFANIFGSLNDNSHNIIYWIKNSSEIWGVKLSGTPIYEITVSLVELAFIFSLILVMFINRAEVKKDKNVFLLIGLFLIQIILLKKSFLRPGMHSFELALWPSILILIYLGSRLFPAVNSVFQKPIKLNSSFLTHPLGGRVYRHSLILLVLSFALMSPKFNAFGSFAKNIIKPKTDAEIVSAEVNKLSSQLQNVQCIFGWGNEGVIALIAKKRICTLFPSAIYVSHSEEVRMLQQLQNESPNAIAFNPDSWSMAIDARKMESRLPLVNNYIVTNYPNLQKIGAYSVVSR